MPQLCMHAAHKLLRRQPRWLLSDFEQRWAEELPQVRTPMTAALYAPAAAVLRSRLAVHTITDFLCAGLLMSGLICML